MVNADPSPALRPGNTRSSCAALHSTDQSHYSRPVSLPGNANGGLERQMELALRSIKVLELLCRGRRREKRDSLFRLSDTY